MSRSVLLDFIRTLAVAGVAGVHILQAQGSHFGESFGVPGFYFVSIGGVAVTVLLVLSGLVLGLRYTKFTKLQSNYFSFLKKRCLRLYPSYYLILIIGVIFYAIRSIYGWSPNEPLTWIDIPLSLSATYAFVDRWGGSLVPTSWFLGLIVSLYLLYPWIAPRFRNRPHSSLLEIWVNSSRVKTLDILLGKDSRARVPNRNLKFEFLLEKELAIAYVIRVANIGVD